MFFLSYAVNFTSSYCKNERSLNLDLIPPPSIYFSLNMWAVLGWSGPRVGRLVIDLAVSGSMCEWTRLRASSSSWRAAAWPHSPPVPSPTHSSSVSSPRLSPGCTARTGSPSSTRARPPLQSSINLTIISCLLPSRGLLRTYPPTLTSRHTG